MGSETSRGRIRSITGTVRFRVTAVATTAAAIVLLVSGGALVLAQRYELTSDLDDTLTRRLDAVAARAVAGPVSASFLDDGEGAFIQLVTDDGRIVVVSPIARRIPAVAVRPNTREDRVDNVDVALSGSPYRVISRRVETPDGTVVIHVGKSLDDIDETAGVLARALRWLGPAVLLVMAFLIWWLVGRTLRPVEAIRRKVSEIGGEKLDERVPEPATNDEIAELARTMNQMLDRLDETARRERRFVADASHELRGPLTRMRAELEVDVAHPGTADLNVTHQSILEETRNLQRLVEDLLFLARSDSGGGSWRTNEAVDLDDVVLRETAALRLVSPITVDTSKVGAARVHGDANQLTRVVRNLLDNAGRHARSRITVTLVELDGHSVLTVGDDGPGIDPSESDRIFERFTRLDDARNAESGGAGLGLAIAREIVDRHGGTIEIDPSSTDGAMLVVTLPGNVEN